MNDSHDADAISLYGRVQPHIYVYNGSSWYGYKNVQAQSSSKWRLPSREIVIEYVIEQEHNISL